MHNESCAARRLIEIGALAERIRRRSDYDESWKWDAKTPRSLKMREEEKGTGQVLKLFRAYIRRKHNRQFAIIASIYMMCASGREFLYMCVWSITLRCPLQFKFCEERQRADLIFGLSLPRSLISPGSPGFKGRCRRFSAGSRTKTFWISIAGPQNVPVIALDF